MLPKYVLVPPLAPHGAGPFTRISSSQLPLTGFKDDHDGISPIETIRGTRYLLKWPDTREYDIGGDRYPCKKWRDDVAPWLVEKGMKVEYHDARKSLMFPTRSDALMFKLTWDANDFK